MLKSICAFTGHRPAKLPWRYDETDSRCTALKEILQKQIEALAGAGITDFFTGMAEGADQYCAGIVLALRRNAPALKLRCILPCQGQENKWSAPARARYHAILEQADSVEFVSRDYYDGCMLARNRRLVDAAGLLLAVYNGALRSGTGATVHYARKMGRDIIVIDPATRIVTHETQNSNLKQEAT
ncbi:MAG: DUF1273 domain-containing protein [Subdoligranulum sp.]|nr:DUF1273 domain-containing protein [Subdoligranulum sp.]